METYELLGINSASLMMQFHDDLFDVLQSLPQVQLQETVIRVLAERRMNQMMSFQTRANWLSACIVYTHTSDGTGYQMASDVDKHHNY